MSVWWMESSDDLVLHRRCFAVREVWLEMDNLMKRMETLLHEVVDHVEKNRNSFGAERGQEGEAGQEGIPGEIRAFTECKSFCGIQVS